MEKIVIIGGGAAGVSAAKTIREVDRQSEINIYGEESLYPYNRIRISKGLLSGLQEDKILIQKKEWYEDNAVKLHLGEKVVGIDTKEKQIILESGEKHTYSKLLLANGAYNFTPPIPGIDKKGVFTLRAFEDSTEILSYLEKSERVLLIGGGVQNLEVAYVLSKNNKEVTVVETAPRLMPRQLDENASLRIKEAAEAKGIEIITGVQVKEIVGSDKASGIVTDNGNLKECDMILYSTGIRANVKIAENTDIETNLGVKVNEKMESSVKDIYAAGDVAEVKGRMYGLWNISSTQGRVAGFNICGQEAIFEDAVPVTNADAFGVPTFSIGSIDEKEASKIITEENENKYYKIFFKGKKLIGAIVLGDMKNSMTLKSAVEKGAEVDVEEGISIEGLIEKLKNR